MEKEQFETLKRVINYLHEEAEADFQKMIAEDEQEELEDGCDE